MVDLHVRAVQWCAHHGHPILVLCTGDGRSFVVAIGADAPPGSLPDAFQSFVESLDFDGLGPGRAQG